jgi:hypothetical protein
MHLHTARSFAFSAMVSSPILVGPDVVWVQRCSGLPDDLAVRRREGRRQQRAARNRQVAGAVYPRGSPLPSEDVAASSVRRIQRRIAANAVASLHLQEVRCRSSAAFQASPITFFSA